MNSSAIFFIASSSHINDILDENFTCSNIPGANEICDNEYNEYDFIMNGGTMIFVLPRIHIVNKENYDRCIRSDFEELSFAL